MQGGKPVQPTGSKTKKVSWSIGVQVGLGAREDRYLHSVRSFSPEGPAVSFFGAADKGSGLTSISVGLGCSGLGVSEGA